MTPAEIHKRRLATVTQWLVAAGWEPFADQFDYAPIHKRAAQKWYPANPSRGAALVAQAARRARGEAIRKAGRPRISFTLLLSDTVSIGGTEYRAEDFTPEGALLLRAQDGQTVTIQKVDKPCLII